MNQIEHKTIRTYKRIANQAIEIATKVAAQDAKAREGLRGKQAQAKLDTTLAQLTPASVALDDLLAAKPTKAVVGEATPAPAAVQAKPIKSIKAARPTGKRTAKVKVKTGVEGKGGAETPVIALSTIEPGATPKIRRPYTRRAGRTATATA